ncbi:MAG: hypothetical protein M3Y04_07830, partial [Actinomycetota bacterium]|nr:hypothetical protein [Actinomycetota bacterium]
MSLPVVLIGPILRRVEPRSVAVFVATSLDASVHLSLYEGVTDGANPGQEMAGVDTSTTRFGAQFHATVATVTLAEPTTSPHGTDDTAGQLPLLPGHRYSYDLRITPVGGTASTLSELGLLTDTTLPGYGAATEDNPAGAGVEVCGVSYADGQLPSFVTPPERVEDLVLAHASCRKPHGYGDPALQYLDDVIGSIDGADTGLEGAPAGRPHQLFLTGDQIYADDVAAALAPGLTALGISLLSGDDTRAGPEEVPSPAGGTPLMVNTTVLPPGFRQRVLGLSGFTSELAGCHLVGFGEFLAMYCVAWNPHLWPVLAVADTADHSLQSWPALKKRLDDDRAASPPDAPVVLGRPTPDAATDVLTPLYGGTAIATAALSGALDGFLADKQQLDGYRREVAKVRRALANVPTYMICDDHDVTDDWFMTGGIRRATTASPCGRAVIRNALTAYVVCQAWGDDPHTWTTEADHQAVLGAIPEMFPSSWTGGLPEQPATDTIDFTLGLAAGTDGLIDFSFTVDGPMHHVR